MIRPTIGRVVWFYKSVEPGLHKGPLAAHVCYVHSDSLVNLMVITENGEPSAETSVTLVQENGEVPTFSYCTWMPYQKGQAQKTESLEKQLAEKAP